MALDDTIDVEKLRGKLLTWKEGRGNFFGTEPLCGIKPGRVAKIAYGDVEPTLVEAVALQSLIGRNRSEALVRNKDHNGDAVTLETQGPKKKRDATNREAPREDSRPSGVVISVSTSGRVTRRVRRETGNGEVAGAIEPISVKPLAQESAMALLKRRLQSVGMLKTLIVAFSFDERFANPQHLANSHAKQGNLPKKADTGIEPIRLLNIIHSGDPLHEIATSQELNQLDAYFAKMNVTKKEDISLVDACERDEQQMSSPLVSTR